MQAKQPEGRLLQTAAAFDQHVKDRSTSTVKDSQSLQRLERLLWQRLQAHTHTFASTILEVVHAWRHYESGFDWQASEAPYPETIRLIDALFSYTEQRPMLHAALSSLKGEILHEVGQIEAAADVYVDAVDDLYGLHLDVDRQRIHNMTTLGHLLMVQGNQRDAEKIFLDVLSYPWYLVSESDLQSLLREYYIKAGLGLIECRKGNLEALMEIFFVPAAQEELLPKLNAAINDAKKATL